MRKDLLQELLAGVRQGKIPVEKAVERLRDLPFQDLGYAKLDHHRELRVGMPEVIFAQGKTPAEVAGLFAAMARRGSNVLVTRATPAQFAAVRRRSRRARYYPRCGCIVLQQSGKKDGKGLIAVVCAGTSDLRVAEEAYLTAKLMGNQVELIADVGVAGLHRLLAHRQVLDRARVLIVCAGMEGALPSVVGGLVAAPVIAVPTSVGYGASFGGVAALLGMLNSCAPNVAVVNIDNGFGAACVASAINRT